MFKDKRVEELEARCERLERKLAACETAIQVWNERRARLVPKEFDDPAVEHLFKQACANAVQGWRDSANTTEMRAEHNKRILFERARHDAIQHIADAEAAAEAKEVAEILAAIEFYQREGRSPSGFEIVDGPPPTQ